MAVLRWTEPKPKVNGRGSGWAGSVVDDLITRPNEWALVAEGDSSTDRVKMNTRGQNLKTVAARQRHQVEVTVRTDNGTTCLYARVIEAAQ